jgi:hypothetical protein
MNGTLLAISEVLSTPEEIRRKAMEVVSRSEYEVESAQDSEATGLITRFIKWVLERIEAFFDSMAGLPDGLRWIIVAVLLVVMMMLVAHIVLTFVRAFRGHSKRSGPIQDRRRQRTPEEWEQAAKEAHTQGDYIGAVRCLFAASIQRIERAEDRPLRKGITNRELLRRYRATSLFEPLTRFVETIDRKWYGHETCEEIDYLKCREEHSRIGRLAERRTNAVGA